MILSTRSYDGNQLNHQDASFTAIRKIEHTLIFFIFFIFHEPTKISWIFPKKRKMWFIEKKKRTCVSITAVSP